MVLFDVFDFGRMTIAQDPTGAVFGIWQAREHIGAQVANEPGTLNWNECQTNDPEKAAAFYQEVFGYEIDEAPMVEAGEVYRVLKVDGRGIAGIMRITPRMGRRHAQLGDDLLRRRHGRDVLRRTEELGGAVLAGPMDIPGMSAGSRCSAIRSARFSTCSSRRRSPNDYAGLKVSTSCGGFCPSRARGAAARRPGSRPRP